ncbi:hypothetical protein ER308_10055 [Egibacter rhizosphaerae]|uniref:SLC26A/SulP transporter domain-containing protein n=1 Tax=Egibacter rhizosphaerae TaxID=1670831 RepID=A0A411YFI3_9ACTN|nr:SulP family inorganic anion transporter [Egibacter rhizosphaerae]QBI19867.1 hypothetical protein ER308_10055 [Egibacter rhizosphaerae]
MSRTHASPRHQRPRMVPAWLRGYDGPTARADGLAGLTVAVLLVPQAMAYATLAGLPPVVGLYAATLPVVVYAFLGTSGQLAVGPVAIVALLTGSAVAPHAGDPTEAVGFAALLALLVGGIQVALALLRLSWLTKVLTHAVIVGFTSAAALVIALSQAQDLLGIDGARGDTALGTVGAVAARLDGAHLPTGALALGSIVLLLAFRRWAPRAPGFLLLLVAGVAVSAGLGLEGAGVAVVGDIPAGLPVPSLPPLDVAVAVSLLPSAVAIALIGHAEGWSVARALARTTREQPRAGRELAAVGSANVAAGLFSAMSVAGGILAQRGQPRGRCPHTGGEPGHRGAHRGRGHRCDAAAGAPAPRGARWRHRRGGAAPSRSPGDRSAVARAPRRGHRRGGHVRGDADGRCRAGARRRRRGRAARSRVAASGERPRRTHR